MKARRRKKRAVARRSVLVGTDISLRTCRAEGYPVVKCRSYPARKAAAVTMDPDAMYELTISNPSYWPNGKLRVGTPAKLAWAINMFTSYRDMWKSFERACPEIKPFCDFDRCPLPTPESSPTFSDFATLAGILNSWNGMRDV